jgi:hypothetical protein
MCELLYGSAARLTMRDLCDGPTLMGIDRHLHLPRRAFRATAIDAIPKARGS